MTDDEILDRQRKLTEVPTEVYREAVDIADHHAAGWGVKKASGRDATMVAFGILHARTARTWKGIETAPKDGTWILLSGELDGEPHVRAGFWGEGDDWFDSEAASKSLTAFGWEPQSWKPIGP